MEGSTWQKVSVRDTGGLPPPVGGSEQAGNQDGQLSPNRLAISDNTSLLVTVVVPAYNAALTIDATLRSLRAQSYTNLEILVVDDGSRDRTEDIVAAHAAADRRIRLIKQANGGVAAARNTGLEAARGSFIAPVDADDLCASCRIEKQVAALEAAGPDHAVAYTWSAFIDEDGRVMDASFMPTFCGDVSEMLCISNFVGNGSAAMMRTGPLRAIGGYDTSLRCRNAQGCEDWSVLLRLAEKWRFAVVPEFLTGYRQSAANMSSDSMQMYRSFRLVAAEHRARFPHSAAALAIGRKNMLAWLLQAAGRDRRHRAVVRLAPLFATRSPRWAYNILASHYLRRSEAKGAHRTAAHPANDGRALAIGSMFPIGEPLDFS